MKKIAILQSNYIPWKGYFDIINMVDEFIVYDDAQYTKRDWRNRNLIKTNCGVKWITIPVEVKNKFNQSIKETKVTGRSWSNKHLKTLRYNYSSALHFIEVFDMLDEIYFSCRSCLFLSEINLLFIERIVKFLGITTLICQSSEYRIEGDRSEKIMNICLQANAGEYITGIAAKSYLDIGTFNRNGINIRWMDYSGYKEYAQLFPPFKHEVSIVDLLFNTGMESSKYLNSFK